ncbi:unnamed protein product, partial [Brassica rapa]
MKASKYCESYYGIPPRPHWNQNELYYVIILKSYLLDLWWRSLSHPSRWINV